MRERSTNKSRTTGNLLGGPQLDSLWIIFQQPIDQRRTRLPDAAVDDHRASAAHFLQAVAIPRDRRDSWSSMVFAIAAIRCSTLMTFISRSYGTRNRCQ